jgi:hypothetical protein
MPERSKIVQIGISGRGLEFEREVSYEKSCVRFSKRRTSCCISSRIRSSTIDVADAVVRATDLLSSSAIGTQLWRIMLMTQFLDVMDRFGRSIYRPALTAYSIDDDGETSILPS